MPQSFDNLQIDGQNRTVWTCFILAWDFSLMRNFLIAVAFLMGLIFIFSNVAELEPVLATLQRGDWRFLALAVLVQVIWTINIAASYRMIYRSLDLAVPIWPLWLAAVAANFVNVVTPSGGVGGLAVLVDYSKKLGVSSGKAAVASMLHLLFEYASLICAIAFGLIVLIRRDTLNFPEIAATSVLVVVTAVIGFVLVLGMKSEQAMGDALVKLAQLANRILRPVLRRQVLDPQHGRDFAHEASHALIGLRKRPREMLWIFGLSLSNKALMLMIFFLMFVSFKVPFSTGTLVGGFSIAYLFTIVSPTPGGIGLVESLLTVTLRALNVNLGSAAVLTLAYRTITFWLPMLLGLISMRWIAAAVNRQDPAPAD
jgi:hypothetical protein